MTGLSTGTPKRAGKCSTILDGEGIGGRSVDGSGGDGAQTWLLAIPFYEAIALVFLGVKFQYGAIHFGFHGTANLAYQTTCIPWIAHSTGFP